MNVNTSIKQRWFVLQVVLALLVILTGVLIYLLLRPTDFIFFAWLARFGFYDVIVQIREITLSGVTFIPNWFLYSLPNGFWAFSFTLLILAIWNRSHSLFKIIWIISVITTIFAFEFLQLFFIIPGTFSIIDMLFGLTGIFIAFLFNHFSFKKYTYEKNYA